MSAICALMFGISNLLFFTMVSVSGKKKSSSIFITLPPGSDILKICIERTRSETVLDRVLKKTVRVEISDFESLDTAILNAIRIATSEPAVDLKASDGDTIHA